MHKGSRKNIPAAMTLAIMLLFSGLSAAQENAPPVQGSIGVTPKYTRVVFDFPRLTAYHVEKAGDTLTLRFDTPSKVTIAGGNLGAIESLKTLEGNAFVIGLEGGGTAKDYRLMRKIVLDVYPGKKIPVAAPPPPEKPPASMAATAPPAPEKPPVPATEKPAPVEETPAPEKTAAVPADILLLPEVAETPQPESPPQEAVRPETTKITVTTLEAVKAAVFTRFGALWIVIDSATPGVQLPEVTGSQAGILGKPKVLKFSGGTAYRYAMPPKMYLGVRKNNLTWEISLNAYPVQPPASQQASVEYDRASRKSKIIVPLRQGSDVLALEDPVVGDKIYVIAANDPSDRVDQARRFSDIDILPAACGMAVVPLNDEINVTRIENFALITSPDGIIATPAVLAGPTLIVSKDETPENQTRLFDFPNWRQGGISRLNENRRALEAQIAAAETPETKQELMMKMALLYFANNFGQEAVGVLRLISQENPDIEKNTNFVALRGAAKALAGQYPDALQDLSNPALQHHPEIDLWSGFVAAATEQWQKANRLFPANNRLLVEYPENIAIPFTTYMAESALRLGRTDTARQLLDSLSNMTAETNAHDTSAISYLKGEIARQEGKPREAIKLWGPVAEGLDRLYHTKASLALTNLRLQEKEITLPEAIDSIDSLRFAWRGDGLEVHILHKLGLLKVQNGEYLSGLQDIKRAADLAESLLNDPDPLHADIARIFNGVFGGEAAGKISPLEAVSIYKEFGNLIPPGEAGAQTFLKVAEFLTSIDLLEKAEEIIEAQAAGGYIAAEQRPAVGARLAAVYLLDAKPEKAIEALAKTDGTLGQTTAIQTERTLLKARAQSQMNQTDAAINTLSASDSRDAQRLRADILWRAGRWSNAAAAIEALLPGTSRPLTPEEAGTVLNAAVAYKLAADSAGLQSLKSRYEAAIAATPLASTFGVVTREGGSTSIADRDTITGIANEVDMFKGFLDSYKGAGNGS